MKTALGVSWNDVKPRRMSALIALLFATLLAIATAMGGATVRTESHSLFNTGALTLPAILGGGSLSGSGASWS